jgi:hypothetical protein
MSAAAEEDVELSTWGGYVSKRLLQVLLRLYCAIYATIIKIFQIGDPIY